MTDLKLEKVSIIIPCYNEEDSVGKVLKQVLTISLPVEREVIVIDDGSTDSSAEVINRFNLVKLVKHETNLGKGAALKTALENTSGDLIVIQDADLEYDPSSIPELVQPILEGKADVVLGSRYKGEIKGMSFSHYLANKALSLIGSILLGMKITDLMTGYKAFTSKAYREVELSSKEFEVEAELVAKFVNMGLRIVEVPIPYRRRPFGQAKINWKHGFITLYAILKYSRRELPHLILVFASYFLHFLRFNLRSNSIRFRETNIKWLLNKDKLQYILKFVCKSRSNPLKVPTAIIEDVLDRIVVKARLFDIN